MKLCRLFVVALFAASTLAYARLPRSERASLEQAIAGAANSAHSGETISWTGSTGYSASIVADKAYSRSTRELCDSCSDPCRAVGYQVTTPQAVTDFRGLRCLAMDGTGSTIWRREGVDRMVRNRVTAPVLTKLPTANAPASSAKRSRRLITNIQESLKRLLYYSGTIDGDFGQSSTSALTNFLSDERSNLKAVPSNDVLILLRTAEGRVAHTTCPRVKGISDYHTKACGTLSR